MPPSVPSERSAADRIALPIATGLGIGYAPIASGTWGSLPGLVLAWGLNRWGGAWGVAGAAVAVALLGTWAAGRAIGVFGVKDPRQVVVDEIAGQLVTLAFLPINARTLIAGFLLFRALDVWKPWPANRLESLPGGSGIMADDLMAGLYGSLILHGVAAWRPEWLGLA